MDKEEYEKSKKGGFLEYTLLGFGTLLSPPLGLARIGYRLSDFQSEAGKQVIGAFTGALGFVLSYGVSHHPIFYEELHSSSRSLGGESVEYTVNVGDIWWFPDPSLDSWKRNLFTVGKYTVPFVTMRLWETGYWGDSPWFLGEKIYFPFPESYDKLYPEGECHFGRSRIISGDDSLSLEGGWKEGTGLIMDSQKNKVTDGNDFHLSLIYGKTPFGHWYEEELSKYCEQSLVDFKEEVGLLEKKIE